MSLLRSRRVANAPDPIADLEESLSTSFSFGSDSEDEIVTLENDRPTMNTKSTSFRLRIRKEEKELQTNAKHAKNEGKKIKLNAKRMGPKSNKTDRGHNGQMQIKDTFLSNSWRAKISPKNFESTRSMHSSPGSIGLSETNSRDDESQGRARSDSVGNGNNHYEILSMTDIMKSLGIMNFAEKITGSKSKTLNSGKTVSTVEKIKVSGRELKKIFVETVQAIENGKWQVFIKNVDEYVDLASFQSSSHDKMNLFHILANKDYVPDDVVEVLTESKMGTFVDALKQVDDHGCIPLHYAANYVGQSIPFLRFLLEAWPAGASVRNNDGDLPLHIAAWAGKGNEASAKVILKVHPLALITGNDVGGTPLHLAVCGGNASAGIVKLLLEAHQEMDYPIDSLDVLGNAPIHIAIKTNAPLSILEAFQTIFGRSPFFKEDHDGKSTLQIAMSMTEMNQDIIHFISCAAPHLTKSPVVDSDGVMPAIYAAEKGMPSYVVKQLLLNDMPIYFGSRNQRELAPVALRTHRFSWWHIATTYPKYSEVLDDILANHANLHEIVALAQETDPEGFGCLYEKASEKVKGIFKKNLSFGDRYEVIALFRAIVTDGMLKVCALDWGDRIAWEELSENESPSLMDENSYATTVAIPGGENGIETEIVYHKKPQREVLLHCCVKGSSAYDELRDEMDSRKRFNFDHGSCQRLFNVHTFDAQKIGCKGEMLCLSLERPILTLQDVFDTSRFRRRKNQAWARKSWNLLKCLAKLLRYFHSVGYVHGYVDPTTIAKFDGSNNWKLTDMRRTTKIGSLMRGELRPCVPPESVFSSSLTTAPSTDRMKTISFDEDFNKTKAINYSVSLDDDFPALEFIPENCVADPSWDIFSFGLVMGQLMLGQSMVLLPNFERAQDAHLKKLYHFDQASLRKIEVAARKVTSAKAANLLIKCLQPIPEDRPSNMDEILRHPYFDDINTI